MLTGHNDLARTGQNLNETILNTSKVNVSNFGKLFWRTVDGYIYAQPLYVPDLTVNGGTHNVVYVATEHNSVYAFDADDPNAVLPLWHVNLGPAVPSQDVCNNSMCFYYSDLTPEIGITSTPVVDPAAGTLYVVAKTKDTSGNYHFQLHALDLTTGLDKLTPAEITASGFNPLFQLNRPGLLLLNGVVYVAFGSAGDFGDWHGFVMAYDASTLSSIATPYNTTPGDLTFVPGETGGGGIFSCGQGLVTDGSSLYFFTGNGPFDANTGGSNFGDSALKISASGLTQLDYFTPSDASFLGQNNVDLGAGGPLLIPGTSLLVGGGKDGYLRVLSTRNMGQFNPTSNSGVVQEWRATSAWIMGSPIYWNSPNFGPTIYLWPSGDYLKAWKFNGQAFQTSPASQNGQRSPAGESDTSPLSLSANGSQSGTGIIWAPTSIGGDPNSGAVPGILRAFDASDLSNELWNSQLDANRDSVGSFAKFNPPTVANGKVYLATFSGQLLVYGLNPPPARDIRFVQVASDVTSTASSQISVTYPTSQDGGNLNVVAVGWADTTAEVQSVTDSSGNSYQLAAGPAHGSGLSQSIYYAKNIIPGRNTVTVNFNRSAIAPDVRALEYSGLDPVSPLDTTSSASGHSSKADSGSAETHFASELIFGANLVANATLGPGAPFVSRIITSPNSDIAEDHVVNVTGSYSASASVSSSNDWVMQMATFKAPAPADFRLSASPTSATVNPGQSATFTITTSGDGGFNGSILLSCSELPPGSDCSFLANSVAPGNSTTLTISTTGPSALRVSPPLGRRRQARLLCAAWLFLLGITVARVGSSGFRQRRNALWRWSSGALLGVLLLLQAACGTSSPSAGGGTPAGTYSISIVGNSQLIAHSMTIQLNVQ